MGSLVPKDPRSFPQKDQPLAETTVIATKNFLLHGPESVTSTTKNECIDSEFSHLENIRSYFYKPSFTVY